MLQVQERPDPQLGAGEVRIDVAAAGINFADVMARMGLYQDAPKTPCVVGYEVAGTIVELGEGASSPANPLTVGQRVFAGTQFGGYASQVVANAGDVLALPDELSFEQGAAIPVNYGTAWAGLIGYGSLQAGRARARALGRWRRRHRRHADRQARRRRGLRHGIAGQARAHPASSASTMRSTTPSSGWERGIGKFDVILDAVGGKSFRTSYSLLRPGGRLVAFGASSVVSGERKNVVTALRAVARMPRFNMIKQMSESKAVIGLNMLTLLKDRGTIEPWITPLRQMLDDGTVKPVIAGTFSFEDAGAAQTMIVERRNVGKVVLVP